MKNMSIMEWVMIIAVMILIAVILTFVIMNEYYN